jgi:hypothetical protein
MVSYSVQKRRGRLPKIYKSNMSVDTGNTNIFHTFNFSLKQNII